MNNSNEQRVVSKDDPWFSQFHNASNPWMARYVYALMFLIANLLAWAARDYGRSLLTEMESKIACTDFTHCPFSLIAFIYLFLFKFQCS